MTRTCRYRWPELRGDYVRAGLGIAFSALPLYATWGNRTFGAIFACLVVLFVAFGARTALRQYSRYRISDEELQRIGLSIFGTRRVTVRWHEVDRVRLAFYSTRRDKSHGWMNLKIQGRGNGLGIDSIIDGFDEIAARSARAAADNNVPLSDATVRNFAALGLAIETDDGRAVSATKGGWR